MLPNISVETDDRNCLIIQAEALADGKVITNDIVEMFSDHEFDIVGRYDNMINTGGVKVFPEQIEAKLQHTVNLPFFITAEEDNDLGQRVVLVLESETNTLGPAVFQSLEKYEVPKNL